METHRLFQCCLNYANRDKNTNFNLYWCFALQFLQNLCCHCIVYLFIFFTTWFLSLKFYSTIWILMVFSHDITLLWMILKLGNEKVLRVLFLYLSCFARVRTFDVSWVTLNLITPITYRVHLTHIFLRFGLLNSLRIFGKCKYGRRLLYACFVSTKSDRFESTFFWSLVLPWFLSSTLDVFSPNIVIWRGCFACKL